MPVATISPNVGMAHGPRCKKGIMFECASDSFGSIHDTLSALGVPERKRGGPRAKRIVYLTAGGAVGVERRWRMAPISSHMARAIHSERVKWPGKAGISFISRSSKETHMPREVMRRMPRRGSTSQKERQAASQPRAEAIEPTSVTGTRIASPRRSPNNVPAVMPMMATDGVENLAWMVAKRGETVPRRA